MSYNSDSRVSGRVSKVSKSVSEVSKSVGEVSEVSNQHDFS